jgi:hypothetical protein
VVALSIPTDDPDGAEEIVDRPEEQPPASEVITCRDRPRRQDLTGMEDVEQQQDVEVAVVVRSDQKAVETSEVLPSIDVDPE